MTKLIRIREGVRSSQWSGECGEEVNSWTTEKWERFLAECWVEARTHASQWKTPLRPGDIITAYWDGGDPEAFEVTEVEANLRLNKQLRTNWTCDYCEGVGCAQCDEGWVYGEDRFVVRHGPDRHPYLCVTRYYEIIANETED